MYKNALWRLDEDRLAAYIEDPEVIRKVMRSYSDFTETAVYYREGEVVGRQYTVPSDRKRSARRLLAVNMVR